jgi:hypothetical protein
MKREFENREHYKRDFDRRPPHHDRHKKPFGLLTTKLFTNKEELVEYVNKTGETGSKIDVFKIEDGLYKVEVLEPKHKEI